MESEGLCPREWWDSFRIYAPTFPNSQSAAGKGLDTDTQQKVSLSL